MFSIVAKTEDVKLERLQAGISGGQCASRVSWHNDGRAERFVWFGRFEMLRQSVNKFFSGFTRGSLFFEQGSYVKRHSPSVQQAP